MANSLKVSIYAQFEVGGSYVQIYLHLRARGAPKNIHSLVKEKITPPPFKNNSPHLPLLFYVDDSLFFIKERLNDLPWCLLSMNSPQFLATKSTSPNLVF